MLAVGGELEVAAGFGLQRSWISCGAMTKWMKQRSRFGHRGLDGGGGKARGSPVAVQNENKDNSGSTSWNFAPDSFEVVPEMTVRASRCGAAWGVETGGTTRF